MVSPRDGKPALLYIIRSDVPEVERHVRESFADIPNFVSVVVDRRVGERRCQPDRPDVERRANDRRTHSVNESLRTLGWAIVRL